MYHLPMPFFQTTAILVALKSNKISSANTFNGTGQYVTRTNYHKIKLIVTQNSLRSNILCNCLLQIGSIKTNMACIIIKRILEKIDANWSKTLRWWKYFSQFVRQIDSIIRKFELKQNIILNILNIKKIAMVFGFVNIQRGRQIPF